jgi:hypothetical protein
MLLKVLTKEIQQIVAPRDSAIAHDHLRLQHSFEILPLECHKACVSGGRDLAGTIGGLVGRGGGASLVHSHGAFPFLVMLDVTSRLSHSTCSTVELRVPSNEQSPSGGPALASHSRSPRVRRRGASDDQTCFEFVEEPEPEGWSLGVLALARGHAICGKAPRSAKSSEEVDHDLHVALHMDLSGLENKTDELRCGIRARSSLFLARGGN